MATPTPNLGLIMPDMSDEVDQTIPALAESFGKIDTAVSGNSNGLAALKAEYASFYGFTNTSGDADKLKNAIETSTAHTLYIDTNIYIDKPINIDGTLIKLKRIIGVGGTIKFTNKGVSGIPCIQISNGQGIDISGLYILGDFNPALINESQWSANIVSPLYLYTCQNMRVHNNTFSTILSAYTVCLRFCTNVFVSQNTILDCWRRNSGDTQGDAVYVSDGVFVKVLNNHIKNNFTSKDNIGRIGVTFEFGTTKDCICSGNYVYGYDRAFHCELIGGKVTIANNIVEGCAMAYVGWQCNNSPVIFEYNQCSNVGMPIDHFTNIGQAYGFISMLSNTPTVEVNANTIISNNTFTLDTTVTSMSYFVNSKITGEVYENNTFTDNTNAKTMFFYNPNDVTINNNRFAFNRNTVKCAHIYFGHLNRHKINRNTLDVGKFTFICTPQPTLSFMNREFTDNTIRNGDTGIVTVDSYLFVNKISLLCRDNTFIDIQKVTVEQDTVIRANQDYTANPELKSVFDNNTLINTQSGVLNTFFFGRLDNQMHPTNTNKKISSSGVKYEMSGMLNRAIVATRPDGTEKYLSIDNSDVISWTLQKTK